MFLSLIVERNRCIKHYFNIYMEISIGQAFKNVIVNVYWIVTKISKMDFYLFFLQPKRKFFKSVVSVRFRCKI